MTRDPISNNLIFYDKYPQNRLVNKCLQPLDSKLKELNKKIAIEKKNLVKYYMKNFEENLQITTQNNESIKF